MLRQDHHETTLMEPRAQIVADRPRQFSGDGNETAAMRPNEPLGDEALHRIVVVGGGAAGLELVTRIGDGLIRRRSSSKVGARVTLVECARTHLWKPMLHEVAAGSMDPGEYEVNYLAQAHCHRFRYRLGEMIGLDRAAKEGAPRRHLR
jgi:NADH:ubiquinone reductase (H+-translocating)